VTERKAPPGILCAIVTPLHDDESPDLKALSDLVDFVIEGGVHGIFLLGTTGEGPLLEVHERKTVAESIVAHVAGRRPVVVHCGAPDTRTAADLARHAEAIGADAVAAVVPYFFTYGTLELERHFRTIAEAAPGVGHYVYENPDRTGYAAGVPLVIRLVNEIANIRGVKDTGDSIGKVTQYLSAAGTRPEVYTGNNLTIHAALVMGAAGGVSALANVVPELVTEIYDAFQEQDIDRALDRQLLLARMATATSGLPYVAVLKHLLSRRGLPSGATRSPQRLLQPEEAAVLNGRLDALDELHAWLSPT